MTVGWIAADPEAIKAFKKKRAVRVRDVNGIEVWRDLMGFSRLIREVDGTLYINDRDFLTIKEATEAAYTV